jgi:GT2 family glycosyltransferase
VISIIILAHDHLDLTRRCLEGISRLLPGSDYEVLLVDNASAVPLAALTDEFASCVSSLRASRNSQNLAFSIANNAAARSARGNLLLFLNNDVVMQPDAVLLLDSLLSGDAGAGAAGGLLLYPDRCTVQHAGMMQMLWGYASNFAVGAPAADDRVRQKRAVWAVTGAMLCVRRELFERIGGFSEDYRWGYEDVDLCLKVQRAGMSVVFAPEVLALHAESATLGGKRAASTEAENYRLFRNAWDPLLVPREQEYLGKLKSRDVRRVAIFGAGRAALGLARILTANGIEVAAFASGSSDGSEKTFCDRPVTSLEGLKRFSFDKLLAGTQFYFQVEKTIAAYDPEGQPIFPVIPWAAA